MLDRPVTFISATSELRSARDLVGKVLYSMGFEPVWQEIASTDGGELLDVLRERIAPASLVLQLVGTRYGAEPPMPTSEFGRVSYTQFEAREAERIGKKVIYHFLDDRFPAEITAPEPPELTSLQAAYRKQLVDSNRLRYDQIANCSDLELSIRRIRNELDALRRQADRRHRDLVRLAVALLVGVAAVGFVASFAFNRQQHETVKVETKLDRQASEMAALRAAVAAAIAPKPRASGQTQAQAIPSDILEKAKVLVARGNGEERALGMIALKEHEEADHIIQELKTKPGNPIDEAFRLFTMEGDNWYQADQPERAIEPYENALALKPQDFATRINLVYALTLSERGDRAAHVDRAISIAEETLKLTHSRPVPWTTMRNSLSIAWHHLPMRDFVRLAGCFNRVLRVLRVVVAGLLSECARPLLGDRPKVHRARIPRDA